MAPSASDGTLPRRDPLVPFLRRACGPPRFVIAALRAARPGRDRDALKVATIGHLFGGSPAAEVDEVPVGEEVGRAIERARGTSRSLSCIELRKASGTVWRCGCHPGPQPTVCRALLPRVSQWVPGVPRCFAQLRRQPLR